MSSKYSLSRIFIGVGIGCLYSIILLFLGLTAMGADDGVFLPLGLGFGFDGSGYLLWPIIGALILGGRGKLAFLSAVSLTIMNILGAIDFLVATARVESELRNFNYLTIISLSFFLIGQVFLWLGVRNLIVSRTLKP